MNPPKTVIVGAASASFGPTTLATIARTPSLRGSQIALVDLDEARLAEIGRLGQRLSAAWHAELSVMTTPDRREALPGADFVVLSTEVPPRERLWRQDWEIPLRYDLRQPYAENGGPGGLIHAFRQIPPTLAIAKDMEQLCPEALLINFSNPLPRVTRAIRKYTSIEAVGKCHQIEVGYGLAAVLLAEELGYEAPAIVGFHADSALAEQKQHLAALGRRHFQITAAGLNHFTWIVAIQHRDTGADLYPALRTAARLAPPTFEPLSMELFRLFGLCPVPGDTHVCEYLPWLHDPLAEPWKRYNLRLYDWNAGEARRVATWERIADLNQDSAALEKLRQVRSEGAAELIGAVTTNEPFFDEAINVPNGSAIPDLPADTIVELPAAVSGAGIQPMAIDPLPAPIAELLRREAALVELVVDAAVTGDRGLALQALLLDPMVGDIERARSILQGYLEANRLDLPQF